MQADLERTQQELSDLCARHHEALRECQHSTLTEVDDQLAAAVGRQERLELLVGDAGDLVRELAGAAAQALHHTVATFVQDQLAAARRQLADAVARWPADVLSALAQAQVTINVLTQPMAGLQRELWLRQATAGGELFLPLPDPAPPAAAPAPPAAAGTLTTADLGSGLL